MRAVEPSEFDRAHALAQAGVVARQMQPLDLQKLAKDLLDRYRHVCFWCSFYNIPSDGKHPMNDAGCPGLCRAPGGSRAFWDFKATVRYMHDKTGICWYCHVPQWGQFHGPGTKENCKWRDVVLPACWLIWNSIVTRDAAHAHFGSPHEDLGSYQTWLCDRSQKALEPLAGASSRPFALTLWLIDQRPPPS
jgi:hypothetical protein